VRIPHTKDLHYFIFINGIIRQDRKNTIMLYLNNEIVGYPLLRYIDAIGN